MISRCPKPTNAKYSFDAPRNTWFCGKKPVDEEEVLVHLIRHAKSAGIPDAGAWATDALADAKTTPELTTAGFVKADLEVRMPIRDEAAAAFRGETKGGDEQATLTNAKKERVRITPEDVIWACDYITQQLSS